MPGRASRRTTPSHASTPGTKNAPTTLAGRRPKQLVVADHRVFVASNADHTRRRDRCEDPRADRQAAACPAQPLRRGGGRRPRLGHGHRHGHVDADRPLNVDSSGVERLHQSLPRGPQGAPGRRAARHAVPRAPRRRRAPARRRAHRGALAADDRAPGGQRRRADLGRRGLACACGHRVHRRRLDARRRRPLAQRVVRQRRAGPRASRAAPRRRPRDRAHDALLRRPGRRRRGQHGRRGEPLVAGDERRAAPRARGALPPVRRRALRHPAVEPRARRRAVPQRRDGEVPPARAVRALRARRDAAAPQARGARAARARAGRGARRASCSGSAGPPRSRICARRMRAGESSAWDSRATGTAASAAGHCCARAGRLRPASCCSAMRPPPGRYRRSRAIRSASASRPAIRRPTGSCSGRGSRPLRSRAAGCRREVFGVRYELAADEKFSRIVRRGSIEALPEEAHTVHVELAGLQPATPYWYRFKWGTSVSRVGRTRTAPALGTTPDAMRFAFVSCQNYSNGLLPRVRGHRRRSRSSSSSSISATTSTRARAPVATTWRAATTSRCASSSRSPTTAPGMRCTRPIRTCRTRTPRTRS